MQRLLTKSEVQMLKVVAPRMPTILEILAEEIFYTMVHYEEAFADANIIQNFFHQSGRN